MDRRYYRRADQSRIGQRHEVVVAMDQIKLGSPFKDFRNVEVFSYFGIDARVFFISAIHDRVQLGTSLRVASREQGHVPATRNESFRDVARDSLPRAVFTGRCSPGDGRQDCDSFSCSRQIAQPFS